MEEFVSAAHAGSSAGPGLLLPFGISTLLIIVGSLGAFDLGGWASAAYDENRGWTPWGRRLAPPAWLPPPYKLVGWAFLVAGVPLFLLTMADIVVTLAR
jgi:hypothetical protein